MPKRTERMVEARDLFTVAPFLSSGLYYAGTFAGAYNFDPLGSNAGNSNNLLVGVPFYVPRARAFDRIGVQVVSAGDASSTIRFGIYRVSLTTGLPTVLVVDAGTAAGDSTGFKEVTINVRLQGIYAVCMVYQGLSSVNPQLNLMNVGGSGIGIPGFPQSTGTNNASRARWQQSGVSGALPNPFAGGFHTGTDSPPRIQLRAV